MFLGSQSASEDGVGLVVSAHSKISDAITIFAVANIDFNSLGMTYGGTFDTSSILDTIVLEYTPGLYGISYTSLAFRTEF